MQVCWYKLLPVTVISRTKKETNKLNFFILILLSLSLFQNEQPWPRHLPIWRSYVSHKCLCVLWVIVWFWRHLVWRFELVYYLLTHSLHSSFPEGKKIEGLFFHLRLQNYTGCFKLVKIKLLYLAWQAKVFGAQGKLLFFKRNNCPVLLISEAAAERPLCQRLSLTSLQQRSAY